LIADSRRGIALSNVSGVAVGAGDADGVGLGAGFPAAPAGCEENAPAIKTIAPAAKRADKRKRITSSSFGGYAWAAFASRTSLVSSGTIANASPTTSRSAKSAIGTPASLLIATIVAAVRMPTLCWIAPEMPTAM